MSGAATLELTDAQLRAAWTSVRKANWPESFEEAMQDPVWGRLVRLTAQHPPVVQPAPVPVQQPQPTRQAPARALPQFQPPPGWVDIKRRASGERDDD